MHSAALILLVSICSYVCAQNNNDPQYPQIHFRPPKNWINDPNGPMYYNGYYHLFYQYNPNAAVWGDMHWGHGISKDLVRWVDLPVAIAPTPGSTDQNGIFSGSATLTGNTSRPIVIVYTGITPSGAETQCLAFPSDLSDPTLTNWKKSALNPVVTSPSLPGMTGFRDPTTAWFVQSTGKWNLLIGSGISGVGGMALLYESSDMVHWTYAGHPLYADKGHIQMAGDMWECPDFFELKPDVYLLKFSGNGWDQYLIGTYDAVQGAFTPTGNGGWDYGRFYASKTFWDESQNRRIIFGWVMEDDNSATARGWAGIQTLPRVITPDPVTGHPLQTPVPELAALRGNHVSLSNATVAPGKPLPISGLSQGSQLEILVHSVTLGANLKSFGVRVRQSGDARESTAIEFVAGGAAPEVGTDRPGNDYSHYTQSVIDPSDCAKSCEQDSFCAAWTSYTAGDVPTCTLKSQVPAPNACSGCTSGFKSYVVVNRANSSLAGDVNRDRHTAPASGLEALHVFVDHSIIEIFVNRGAAALVSRIYPTLPDSQGVEFYAVGESVEFSVDIWELASIWDSAATV